VSSVQIQFGRDSATLLSNISRLQNEAPILYQHMSGLVSALEDRLEPDFDYNPALAEITALMDDINRLRSNHRGLDGEEDSSQRTSVPPADDCGPYGSGGTSFLDR
jgi:hypothetical protein